MKRERSIQVANTPREANGTEGLKVIGAGFGRTGTLSLKAALETLGLGPCYHMIEVFRRPEDIARWEAAARGKPIDWNELFAGYQATVDWPSCAFYQELMKVYPDAKVLLTVRDPEHWYESARSTIYQVRRRTAGSPLAAARFLMMRALVPNMRHAVRMMNSIIWEGTFGGNFEDRDHAMAVFAQHIEEVKQQVPPARLLVYNVKEGWEPLCAFLGVEVPRDQPFPHLNDRFNFVGNRRLRNRERLADVLLVASLLGVLLLLLRLLLSKKQLMG